MFRIQLPTENTFFNHILSDEVFVHTNLYLILNKLNG